MNNIGKSRLIERIFLKCLEIMTNVPLCELLLIIYYSDLKKDDMSVNKNNTLLVWILITLPTVNRRLIIGLQNELT